MNLHVCMLVGWLVCLINFSLFYLNKLFSLPGSNWLASGAKTCLPGRNPIYTFFYLAVYWWEYLSICIASFLFKCIFPYFLFTHLYFLYYLSFILESIFPSNSIFNYLSIYIPISISMYVSIFLALFLSIYPGVPCSCCKDKDLFSTSVAELRRKVFRIVSTYLSIYQSTYLNIYIYPSTYLSVYLS